MANAGSAHNQHFLLLAVICWANHYIITSWNQRGLWSMDWLITWFLFLIHFLYFYRNLESTTQAIIGYLVAVDKLFQIAEGVLLHRIWRLRKQTISHQIYFILNRFWFCYTQQALWYLVHFICCSVTTYFTYLHLVHYWPFNTSFDWFVSWNIHFFSQLW